MIDTLDTRLHETVELLQDLLLHEGWPVYRIGRALAIGAEAPFTPEKLARLDLAAKTLRDVFPVFCHRLAEFPELSRAEAQATLLRLEKCHSHEDFRANGWAGLCVPEHWPPAVKLNTYMIYVQSLRVVGAEQ